MAKKKVNDEVEYEHESSFGKEIMVDEAGETVFADHDAAVEHLNEYHSEDSGPLRVGVYVLKEIVELEITKDVTRKVVKKYV